MRHIILSLLLLVSGGGFQLSAQFAPGLGKPGTTAMHKDSSAFVSWASSAEISRGPVQIGIDSLGYASIGSNEMATGKAGDNGVVSLGDGGTATLRFAAPIINGEGWDFAVFENSFDGLFLELAFVEVSSDGERFVRFPSTSLTDTNALFTGFDTLYPEKLNNLAGKYPLFYGTPFDLEELKDSSGLDVNHITHVRIVDVIGTNNPLYCTRDAAGRIVRDPWPTPFSSGGFDLDAVGVIHQSASASVGTNIRSKISAIWPQPAASELNIEINEHLEAGRYEVFSISGQLMKKGYFGVLYENRLKIVTSDLPKGLYLLSIQSGSGEPVWAKFIVSP